MVEALLLVGYLGLPIMLFLVTRSVTVTAIWLTFTISLTGVGLQALLTTAGFTGRWHSSKPCCCWSWWS